MKKFSRRQVLTGVGAAAGLVLTEQPRLAWAPPPPPPQLNGICAVHLAGATTLSCPAIDLNFPYSSSFLFVHVKYKANAYPAGGNLLALITGTGIGSVGLGFTNGPKRGKVGLSAVVRATVNGSIAMSAPFGSIPWDTNYHDLKLTTDSMNGIMDITIDDASIPGLTYLQGSTNGFEVALSEMITSDTGQHLPLTWNHGNSYVGDLADLCVFAPAAYVDIRSQAVKDSFTDATGVPVRHATNGKSIFPDTAPGIWLSGPKTLYPLNLTDHPFSETGQFTVTGPIAPASVDPWGFTGES